MKKRIVLLIFSALFGPINSFGGWARLDAFATIDPIYKPDASSTLLAPNMPQVESQDSLGICYGFSSAAVLQQHYCQRKKLDCGKLDPKKKISPLQMAAFSTPDKNGSPVDIDTYESIANGGSGFAALLTAVDLVGFGRADSCYPFDQFVSRYGDDPRVTAALFEKLRVQFNQNKTEGTTCIECLSQNLLKDFQMKIENSKLEEALGKHDFEHFLFSIFLKNRISDPVEKDCTDLIKFSSTATVKMFPDEKDKVATQSELIGVMKEILKNGRAIELDGICLQKSNGKCTGAHTVAIAGYRKACKANGECRESFKVHNSWGQSWQKEYDDGWVDAQTLLKETEPLEAGVISWIEPKEKGK
ncbi:hypothetical protein [Bdellovibrio sp.]|uniref:hypothetical protein n=1 Tax=Bdellovibrio sp. TaxID=28201 RepID=UPI0039E6E91D